MEEASFKSSRRKSKETTIIDVNLHLTLTGGLCLKIAEDFLKYILYQRSQIPVQFDSLVREAGKDDELESTATGECFLDQPDQIQNRRAEIKKLQDHMKRKRWLIKARNFIDSFRKVMENLRCVFECGDVEAVNVVVGGSVLMAREVYCISLPPDYIRDFTAPPSHSANGIPTLAELFRALVTNEELLNIVNRPSSLQRVWIMVKKSGCPLSLLGASPYDGTYRYLIPRPQYSPGTQTQVVKINLTHFLPPDTSMVLTPSVGSGTTQSFATSCRKGDSTTWYQLDTHIFGFNDLLV